VFESLVASINDALYSYILLILLVLGGLYFSIRTKFVQFRLLKEQFHMDNVIVLPFDRKLRTMHWLDFFRLLVERYNAAGFVCGEDFRFGHRGEGNAQKLAEVCAEAGLPCVVVPQQKLNGQTVSSTLIRSYIETGHMSKAVAHLGHPHILTGKVIRGHQLGRTIGMPTANLMLPKELVVPKFGVYVCIARVDGKRYPAVTNIGTRPTVAGIGITVETWLLDYNGDLYGREITLEFYQFLRPEQKFTTLEAMQQEILRNAEEAREILKTVL